MKTFIALVTTALLAGCGTVGGAVSGVGQDIKRVGDYIKSR